MLSDETSTVSSAASAEIILPPLSPATSSTPSVAIVLVGRADTQPSSYTDLVQAIQEYSRDAAAITFVLRSDLNGVEDTLARVRASFNVTDVFFMGHSMADGGILTQSYVNSTNARGLIFLAAFLQRTFRPDVTECLAKASVQPKRSLRCPLGCLADGAHDCFGPNTVAFPVPVLSVSGDLDGVVRITRIAEAFYTQKALTNRSQDYFAVVRGMNHAVVFNGSNIPPIVLARDLPSSRAVGEVIDDISAAVKAFVLATAVGDVKSLEHLAEAEAAAEVLLDPIIDAFVNQEGNWFFTGADDEHGHSNWASGAQHRLCDPLPDGVTWLDTNSTNEFRLMSDEEKIPPYFRLKHRANITVTQTDGGMAVSSDTIAQLRFIKVSITEAQAGLNGWAIIKEEKLNVLTQLMDDGSEPVSAIEIATKMASRQLMFNRTGTDSPPTLDDGDRCRDINVAAMNWAISRTPSDILQRYKQSGKQLVMVSDKRPSIPAGPFWIWSYMEYTDKGEFVEVASYETFFGLDSNPYGAGTHYCKLLSPARAIEWIYVDSLRKASR